MDRSTRLRGLVAHMIVKGSTNRQIDAWMEENYGVLALGRPRRAMAWITPPLMGAAGLGAVLLIFRKSRQAGRNTAPPVELSAAEEEMFAADFNSISRGTEQLDQLAVILVTTALAIWIARPLAAKAQLSTAAPNHNDGDSTRVADLLESKQSVYRSLIDLEFDNKLGKLSPDDYIELRQEAKQETLHLIRQIDGPESDREPKLTLEEEIGVARARLRKQ